MSVKNLCIIKSNVMVYERKVPHILMKSDSNLIVRIGIPVHVYNECRDKIAKGEYIKGTTVSRVMHLEGHFKRYINSALSSIGISTEYMPGNIVGITTGDNSVFTAELYIIPASIVISSDYRTNSLTIADSDVEYVRLIDYIVPIDERETEMKMSNISSSVQFETGYK